MNLTPKRFVALIWSSLILLAVPARGAESTDGSLTVTPSPLNLSVRSGETASVALQIANPTTGALNWNLELLDANNRADNLEGVLAAIDASGTTCNGPLPSRYDFTEGETGTAIATGVPAGYVAIFNQGNKLMTNLGGPLAYSNGVVAASSQLGGGGRYFSRKLPGLFLFGADLNGVSWFEVAGAIPGGGSRKTSSFSLTVNGKHWSGFAAQTAATWHNVHHLILVDQDGLTQSTGAAATDQKHRVTGLTGKRRLYYLMFTTGAGGFQPDSVFESLAGRLLDTVPVTFSSILTFTPASGSVPAAGTLPVTATATAVGIPAGNRTATLNVKSPAGALLCSAPVNLEVSAPRLTLPPSINQSAIIGMAPASVTVPLSSNLPDAQAWSASLPAAPPWLSLVTASGTTPAPLELRFMPGSLAAGTYTTNLRITAGPADFETPVMFTIAALNVTKLLAHPTRPILYGINTAPANETPSQLLEIDAATAAVLRVIAAGLRPMDADLDPASGRLYVSNWGLGQVRVIDVDNWLELPSLGVDADVYRVEIAPNNRLITETKRRDFDSSNTTTIKLWNTTSGAQISTLSSQVHGGDGQLDPTGQYYFHCDSGISDSTVQKYDLSGGNFTRTILGPNLGYGSPQMVLSGDGKRLFWVGRALDESLRITGQMPMSAVYAANQTGELAVTADSICWSDSSVPIATLPFSSTVAAISAADAYLVRFNATNKTLNSTPVPTLADLPGPWPRPGQDLDASPQRISWSPVPGATAYRVYLATDAAALQVMITPTATVTTAFYDIPSPLAYGRFHWWRVDAVLAGQVVPGKAQTFGIRFPQGPIITSTSAVWGSVAALAISDRHLLLGNMTTSFNAAVQLYDFNPVSGASSPLRSFAIPGNYLATNFGSALALDAGRASVGAASYDTPASGCGAAFVFQSDAFGYWQSGGALMLPNPVAAEAFGSAIATAGNLMLIGTGTSTNVGRVAAYVTEPSITRVQVFSAADAVADDGFGKLIAIEGNRAIIAAPGNGASRLHCLYAFKRSTTTGLWAQTQKIAIPGVTVGGSGGSMLALSGSTLATNNGTSGIAVFTENAAGQWVSSATISRSGNGLALCDDQLFIGNMSVSTPDTIHTGETGVVYSYRLAGSTWAPGPTIIPNTTRSNFGQALTARDGWLVASDAGQAPARLYRIKPNANQPPRFLPEVPFQAVAGRAFSTTIHATDVDGNGGLMMDKLQGPAWLALTDNGDGEAVLAGTPGGNSGDVFEIQLRARDSAGGQTLYTYKLTLLAPADVPSLTQEPLDSDLGEGQQLVLRAAATGIAPFQWQWYHNGEPINGATRAILDIGEVAAADAGTYRVRVTNVAGEDVSADAVLTVRPATRFAGDWSTFGSSSAHTGRHPAALDGCAFVPAWSQPAQSGRLLNRASMVDGRAFVVPASPKVSDLAAKAFDLATGALLWSFPFPYSIAISPPSVHNGRVYFQRVNYSQTLPDFFCLDAQTGAKIWEATITQAQLGSQEAAPESLAVTEQGIFLNGSSNKMLAFNFDGSQRFPVTLPQYGTKWAPTLATDRLFTWVGGTFIEHNPLNGAILWRLDNLAGSGQVVAQADSAALLSGTSLYCVDLSAHSRRWQAPGLFSGSPAIGDSRVFAIQGTAVSSYALADGNLRVTYQTDAASGTVLLHQPIVCNDRLLISSESNTWIFNLADGTLLQTLNAGGRLSYSNRYLLAAGNDGVLRAFLALSNNAQLADLDLNAGMMVPDFDTHTTSYMATVPFATGGVIVTPTTEHSAAAVQVAGVPVASGSPSGVIDLAVGNRALTTVVTAEDGITTNTYTITVTRLPENFVFRAASDVPVTATGFVTGGYPVHVILDYPPAPGTILTMVNNTGLGFIQGTFGNLAQGQRIALTFDGHTYNFVANYFGGTGNDLVLQWADTTVAAWGSNSFGQLGDASTTRRLAPVRIDDSGVLAGKTIVAVGGGYLHSLALCSDGTLAAWGYNVYGQLGNGGIVPGKMPVAVDQTGALAGKTVIAVSVGPFHNLALCSDGSVAAWGYNNYGQLGTGDKVPSRVPVLVEPRGALAGKQVVALAAAAYGSFALFADGTLAAWGFNDDGELGDGTTTNSPVPVAVDTTGVLAGKQIASLSAGRYHTLALCTDGTLVAWGYNNRGQLGNGTTTSSKLPVVIGCSGVLAGKTVVAIRAGGAHSLALCADGTLAAWGWNHKGQLGVTGITQSSVPLASDMAGVTAGTRIAQIAIGGNHSLVHCAVGTLAAWGDNACGQLGNHRTTSSSVPVAVDLGELQAGSRVMMLATGSAAIHNLAVVALPTTGDTTRVTALTGAALGDSDHDGIPDLIAYAFGLSGTSSSAQLPQQKRMGDNLEIQFTEPAGVTDINYGAEWSPTMQPGSWTSIPDTGNGTGHIFSVPVDTAPNLFMRLKVMTRQP